MSFAGKTVLIGGAASGMGLLSAQKYAAEGAKVVLTDVNKEAVEKAAADICANGGEATGVVVDVRDYAQVKNSVDVAIEKYGSVDILVSCAGGSSARVFGRKETWHELPIEVIDWGLDVNLKGTVYFCHAVLGQMIKQKSGVLITLGSIDGLTGSGSIDYSATKSAMLGLTKSLSLHGAPHGIRACCVTPGPVLTRATMANMKTPLGRAAEPVEVVDLIMYLTSDKAAFITGSNHVIDGGRNCGGRV